VQKLCDLVQKNIFKFGDEWRGQNKCALSTENKPYLGNDKAKVTINH